MYVSAVDVLHMMARAIGDSPSTALRGAQCGVMHLFTPLSSAWLLYFPSQKLLVLEAYANKIRQSYRIGQRLCQHLMYVGQHRKARDKNLNGSHTSYNGGMTPPLSIHPSQVHVAQMAAMHDIPSVTPTTFLARAKKYPKPPRPTTTYQS